MGIPTLEVGYTSATAGGGPRSLRGHVVALEEKKFLDHKFSDEGVKADRERSEVILRYPVPKNQRQLPKLLGICNFHQQFILN